MGVCVCGRVCVCTPVAYGGMVVLPMVVWCGLVLVVGGDASVSVLQYIKLSACKRLQSLVSV